MNITVNGVSITLTEEQLKELNEAVKKNQEPSKPTAEEWLKDFISQPFKVIHTKGFITYYLGDQWIFRLDLKTKTLLCYYCAVWEVFYKEYGLKYEQIQDLHKNVVNKAFNCEGYIPNSLSMSSTGW